MTKLLNLSIINTLNQSLTLNIGFICGHYKINEKIFLIICLETVLEQISVQSGTYILTMAVQSTARVKSCLIPVKYRQSFVWGKITSSVIV